MFNRCVLSLNLLSYDYCALTRPLRPLYNYNYFPAVMECLASTSFIWHTIWRWVLSIRGDSEKEVRFESKLQAAFLIMALLTIP